MASSPTLTTAPISLFHRLDSYPWATDTEFQHGLRAILGPDPSPVQAEQLTLRARCFYYSRKYHTPIDFDAYREWHARQGSPVRTECAEVLSQDRTLTIDSAEAEFPPTDSSLRVPGLPGRDSAASTEPGVGEPPAPYPVSFSQIVELITAGQQVPGIKEVPDTLLEGQASRAVKAKRRKPWETELEERDVEAIGDAVGKGPVYL